MESNCIQKLLVYWSYRHFQEICIIFILLTIKLRNKLKNFFFLKLWPGQMTFNNKNEFPLYIGLNLLIKFEVQPSNTHISNWIQFFKLDVDPQRDDDASPMSTYRCMLRPTWMFSALQHKSKYKSNSISNFFEKKKIKFSGFHGVVLVKTFPLMYKLLM